MTEEYKYIGYFSTAPMTNRKISDYSIVTCYRRDSDDLNGFFEKINKFISEGWEVYGYLTSDVECHLYQVMVKYEETKFENTKKYLDIIGEILSPDKIEEIEKEAKEELELLKIGD